MAEIFSTEKISLPVEGFVGGEGVDVEKERGIAEGCIGELLLENGRLEELIQGSGLPEEQKLRFGGEAAHVRNEIHSLGDWLKEKLDSLIVPLRRNVHITMKGYENRTKNRKKVEGLSFLIENINIEFADGEHMEDELINWIAEGKLDSVPEIEFPLDAFGLSIVESARTANHIASLSDVVELIHAANLTYRLKTEQD